MKRSIVVVFLILLAGCSAAPWAQPTSDDTNSNSTLQINNSSENYAYIIGHNTPSPMIRAHTVVVQNNLTEPVEFAITANTEESTSVSVKVQPDEIRRMKVQKPLNYTITVVGPNENLEKQFPITKAKFNCNDRTHVITVNSDEINQTVVSTMLGCNE